MGPIVQHVAALTKAPRISQPVGRRIAVQARRGKDNAGEMKASGSFANSFFGWRNGFPSREDKAMSNFKGRHFEGEIVRWAVRWYCRYGVSYRDLE